MRVAVSPIAVPFGSRDSVSRVGRREFESDSVDWDSRTRRVQIFSGLSHEELSHIALRARGVRKARGEFIYMPGDRAEFVYILRQGRVKLSVLSETGKEIAMTPAYRAASVDALAMRSKGHVSSMLCAVAFLLWTNPASSADLEIDANSFRCITKMIPVRQLYVDNLRGNLDGTLAAAN